MAVRRKSNWYIYLISFIIALAFAIAAILAFQWYLFPEETESVGLDQNGELTADFKPSAKDNFNAVIMLCDSNVDVPEVFMMACYSAVDNRLVFIPFPNGISMPTEGRTLQNVYAAQGGEKVIDVLGKVTGINCDFYSAIDRKGFITLVSSFGNLDYDVTKTMIINDGVVAQTLNAGRQRLDAETIFRLLLKADFGEGESYRFNCIGSIFADLINQNFRVLDGNSSLMDNYFRMILEHSQTDLSEDFYVKHKAALLNSAEYGVSPAEYYIPYGEYTDDGGFVLAENSIITIKQKAGLA